MTLSPQTPPFFPSSQSPNAFDACYAGYTWIICTQVSLFILLVKLRVRSSTWIRVKIILFVVSQKYWRILFQMGFRSSFDEPWSAQVILKRNSSSGRTLYNRPRLHGFRVNSVTDCSTVEVCFKKLGRIRGSCVNERRVCVSFCPFQNLSGTV